MQNENSRFPFAEVVFSCDSRSGGVFIVNVTNKLGMRRIGNMCSYAAEYGWNAHIAPLSYEQASARAKQLYGENGRPPAENVMVLVEGPAVRDYFEFAAKLRRMQDDFRSCHRG